MPRCPNCGQATARTEDWACPWCGYPLLSGSFKKIPASYRELREAARASQEAALEEEGEVSIQPEGVTLPPGPAPQPEPVVGPEFEAEVEPEPEVVLEPEAEVKAEPEVELEPEPEAAVEPEPQAVVEPEAEVKAEAEPEPALETVPETVIEPESEVVETEAEAEAEAVVKAEAVPEAVEEPDVTPAAMELTVDELLLAYATDGMAADAKFVGKILKITGVVDRIEVKENLDVYYITLEALEREWVQSVRCVFGRSSGTELNRLTREQKVTVQGMYDGSIMDVRLRDCSLVG